MTVAAESLGEVFGSVEECVLAAFDEGVVRLGQVIGGAAAGERGWRERVRAALVAVLAFLDEQADWARFLLLDPPVATIAIAERRQQAVQALASALGTRDTFQE